MNLLLDTHTLLWFFTNDSNLSTRASWTSEGGFTLLPIAPNRLQP